MTRTRARPARARPARSARTKLYLTYPQKLVKEPLIYRMSQDFDLVFNIRGASVNDEIGIIALELDGTDAEIRHMAKIIHKHPRKNSRV